MATDKNELGTKLARLPPRHAAMDAEGLRFVGGGKHHPATDSDRLALQRRVEHLLDRGIESIEIGMEDGGRRFHSTAPSQKGQRLQLRPGFAIEHRENKCG
jgi:hypothetical protein